MRDVSDILTVSFDSGVNGESALCVARKHGEKTIMLKVEFGEQADILYHLLTEQMTKEHNYMCGYKDGKSDVLDKIRAKIEQISDTMGVNYNQYVVKIDVLKIIDKYKAESEGEE